MLPEENVGNIIWWQGSLATIPGSWALCDGSQGTPDLRDRFLFGNSIGTPPTVDGGGTTHDHVSTSDGHVHEIPGSGEIVNASGHDSDVGWKQFDLTTDPGDNLPPYYSLCFIMFVGD